jgi:hypothetical protein
VTDVDSEYDLIHEKQTEMNSREFERTHDVPRVQKYRVLLDVLHLLKGTRHRTLKGPAMIVRLEVTSRDLTHQTWKTLLARDIPPIVFSEDPVTKMQNSLPIILFRFETRLELYEAREFGYLPISFLGCF